MIDATYPILLVPKGMTQHLQQVTPRPSAPNHSLPSCPRFEDPPPRRLDPESIKTPIVNAIAAVTIGAVASFLNLTSIGIPLIFISLSLLVVYLISHAQQYPQRQRHYQRQLEKHQSAQRKYDKATRDAASQQQQYDAAIAQWQKQNESLLQLVWVELKYTQRPGRGSNYRAGYSEAAFKESLRQHFGDRIHTGCTIRNPKYDRKHPYTADFAYIEKTLGLYIDIEIDEPYVYNQTTLTHCIGSDDERNGIFLERGWIVLRFAEEQVVCYPQQCCQTIAEVVATFQGQQSYGEIPFPPAIKHWTKEEAMKMMLEQYRQTYL